MNQNVGRAGGSGSPLEKGYKDLVQTYQPIADCTARVSITAADALAPPVDAALQSSLPSDHLRQRPDACAYTDMAQALKQKYLNVQHGGASAPNFDSVLHGSDTHSRRGSHASYRTLSASLDSRGAVAALSGLINSSMEPSCNLDGGSVDLAHTLARSHTRAPVKQCAPLCMQK
jgi:hypothetical protein